MNFLHHCIPNGLHHLNAKISFQKYNEGELGLRAQVRGANTPVEELAYIVQQSNSSALVVQDAATLDKLVPFLTAPESGINGSPLQSYLRFVIVLWGEPSQEATKALDVRIRTFDEVLALGQDTSSFQPATLVR